MESYHQEDVHVRSLHGRTQKLGMIGGENWERKSEVLKIFESFNPKRFLLESWPFLWLFTDVGSKGHLGQAPTLQMGKLRPKSRSPHSESVPGWGLGL